MRSYHGRGPDGYKPGRFHGVKTNLDYAREAAEPRALSPGDLARQRREEAKRNAA